MANRTSTNLVMRHPELIERWCEKNKLRLLKFNYKWTLHNISKCWEWLPGEIGQTSPIFSPGDENSTKWHLYVALKNDENKPRDEYFKFTLHYCAHNDVNVTAQYRVSIINSDGVKNYVHNNEVCTFEPGQKKSHRISIDRKCLLDEQYTLVRNDKLSFFCEIIVHASAERDINNVEFIEAPIEELPSDASFLYNNKEWSDVTIVVKGNAEFRAHKAILASRSNVFAAMFRNEMQEKKSNLVSISDIDENIFREILHYIYTGKVTNIETIDRDLLAAANKYDLQNLKSKCERKIMVTLTINNVMDYLIFADFHAADQLENHAIRFICENAKEVVKTEGYKSMIKTHPHFLDLIFRAFVAKSAYFFDENQIFVIKNCASELVLT